MFADINLAAPVAHCDVRIQIQCLTALLECLAVATRIAIDSAQRRVYNNQRQRIQFARTLHFSYSAVSITDTCQMLCIKVMCKLRVRLQSDRTAKVLVGGGPVQFPIRGRDRPCGVGFGERKSRITVSGDTLRTSAVSSTVSPPKYFSSTITLPRVQFLQIRERLVQTDHVRQALIRNDNCFVQRNSMFCSSPLCRLSIASMIHQNLTHRFCCNSEKVRAIFSMTFSVGR